MRYDCPTCGLPIKKRRAKSARRRLDAGRQGRPILYTVFTVPPELRHHFAGGPPTWKSDKGGRLRLTYDRRKWRQLCRLTWSILRDVYGGDFGIEATHPVGDPDEGGDPGVFHPHINLLWVVRRGRSSYLDVRTLRRLYCVALSKVCGVPVRVCDVWHHYYKAPKELAGRIGYVMRTFPGCSEWAGSVRWYGHYPKLPVLVKACPKCGQIFLYVGRADEADYQQYCRLTHGPTPAGP